jgi:DNA-binding transcriptional LysR family regulator
VLTAEGRKLAAFGRDVRSRGHELLAELQGQKPHGPVILASGQGAFLYMLGPAIKKFPKERWPLRLLSMSGPETLDAIRDARADVGVAVTGSETGDLRCREIRRVGQRVIVPRGHRLSKRRRLAPGDLNGEAIVVAPEGSPHRLMLTQALKTLGARWTVAVEATGWELMIQFARYGLGIAVVNDFCPVPRGFVGIPLEGVPEASYSVVTRLGKLPEPHDVLLRLIVETEIVRSSSRH